MAIRQTAYDNLMAGISKNVDISSAFNMIINNPYRILGASTFLDENQLLEIYKQWEKAPDKYKPQFDKTKLGAPTRTYETMEWALENADSYVYKLFWFSDPDIAVRLGNKGDFIEFFGKKRSINSTDYNSFLSQYMFLCIFDREFTMVEQWGIMLNLINDLLNISVGRFWAFFSGNKIEAIDNNKMAFLYNEFKDNILFPIREMITKKSTKADLNEVIHIHSVIKSVEQPGIQFAKLESIIFERFEKWFIKEAEYVNNVLLSKVTDVNATSMEEKLALTNAYNYIVNELAPEFRKLVNEIIPEEHSMNTRLRMMFSSKFIVVSKILSNSMLYHESLNLCQLFNELYEDEYISGEIAKLNLIIKQEETTRMKQHAPTGTKKRDLFDEENKGLAPPSGLGELEELEKERKQEFFNRGSKAKGIDYKEVIQEVLSNELRLVKDEKRDVPQVELAAAAAEAEAEANVRRIKETIEEYQKKHEQEINEKLEHLHIEYKKSMRRWGTVIFVMLAVMASALSYVFYELAQEDTGVTASALVNLDSNKNDSQDSNKDAQKDSINESGKKSSADSGEIKQIQNQIEEEKAALDTNEANMASIKAEMSVLEDRYNETKDKQYTDALAEKQEIYDQLKAERDQTINSYNAHLEQYNSMKQ